MLLMRIIHEMMKMFDSTLDLFCQHEDDKYADEYAMELEQLASKYEVTVDYILMEFV